jgi:peptidoglycan hydrolase-like protein with peptidoglycan-binding domain
MKLQGRNLVFGMQGNDVARVHQAIQKVGRTVLISEAGVFGAGTVAVVKALQADFGLLASGIVDAATIKAINAGLAQLVIDAHTVLDANGDPLQERLRADFQSGLQP